MQLTTGNIRKKNRNNIKVETHILSHVCEFVVFLCVCVCICDVVKTPAKKTKNKKDNPFMLFFMMCICLYTNMSIRSYII